jgi:hypothetical protein
VVTSGSESAHHRGSGAHRRNDKWRIGVAPDQIKNIKVVRTVVGGNTCMREPEAGSQYDSDLQFSVGDGKRVDGSVNEHDFPIVTGFAKESRVHAGSLIDAVIDGVGESSPSGVAPTARRHVMDAHFSLWRRGHLTVDEKQREHLTCQFVPIFVDP